MRMEFLSRTEISKGLQGKKLYVVARHIGISYPTLRKFHDGVDHNFTIDSMEKVSKYVRGLPIANYQAKEADFQSRKILMFNINSSIEHSSVYDAVRYAWKINPKKANQAELVLAIQKGSVVGAFIPEKWLEATPANFPMFPMRESSVGRWGFIGYEAPEETKRLYLNKKIPEDMRKRGAANPVKYNF